MPSTKNDMVKLKGIKIMSDQFKSVKFTSIKDAELVSFIT